MAQRESKDAIDVDVDDGGSDEAEGDAENDAFAKFPSYDCPVCYDLMREPVATECGHSFCRACLPQWTAQQPACPVCGRAILRLPLAHVLLRETIGARHPDRGAVAAAASAPSVGPPGPPLPPAHVLQEPLHRLDHGADYIETRGRWLAFKTANATLAEAAALAAFRVDFRRIRWRLAATLVAFAAVYAAIDWLNLVGETPDDPTEYRHRFATCLLLPWPASLFSTLHCDALESVVWQTAAPPYRDDGAFVIAIADLFAPHVSLWLRAAVSQSLAAWMRAPFAFLLLDAAVARDLGRLAVLRAAFRWMRFTDPDAMLSILLTCVLQVFSLPSMHARCDPGPSYTSALILGAASVSPTVGPILRFWACVLAGKFSLSLSRLIA